MVLAKMEKINLQQRQIETPEAENISVTVSDSMSKGFFFDVT
jgi:hypothetical protein